MTLNKQNIEVTEDQPVFPFLPDEKNFHAKKNKRD